MPGMDFADSYMNEYGVTIASNACRSREDKAELEGGGIGYWLRRIMAQRAKSAREAVEIAGSIIEDVGYASSGRSYCVADPNEAWILSVVEGKHWLAQRVPDDQVVVIPNYHVIQQVDMTDEQNFLGAPDIIDYAVQRGWYDPKEEKGFDFQKAYSPPGNLKAMDNILRKWRVLGLLAKEPYSTDDDLPFAFEPKKKVSITDLMGILRDHYEGTEYCVDAMHKTGDPHQCKISPICNESTQYGFVAQLRGDLPVELGAVMWIAPRRPCTQPFVPWYLGLKEIPKGYANNDNQTAISQHFDENKIRNLQHPEGKDRERINYAFPAIEDYTEKVLKDYRSRIKGVSEEWRQFEDELIKSQKEYEEKVLELYKSKPGIAISELTHYTHKMLEKHLELLVEDRSLEQAGKPTK